MKHADINSVGAKLRAAEKSFLTAFKDVDRQWMDIARRDFEEDYVEQVAPHVKQLVEAISRLAAVLATAESQCGSPFE